MNVVQERRIHLLAFLVVTAANDEESLVGGQVGHGVADATTWRHASLLELDPVSGHDLVVHAVRLQVAQFRLQLASAILSTEEINTVHDCVG